MSSKPSLFDIHLIEVRVFSSLVELSYREKACSATLDLTVAGLLSTVRVLLVLPVGRSLQYVGGTSI